MFDWLKKPFADSKSQRNQQRAPEPEPEFKPAKLPPRRTETSGSQAATSSSGTITIERGLAAHFKQPSGESRPGVDWALRVTGESAGVILVRTYYASNPPQQSEQQVMADRAVRFIQQKLAQGWIPEPGALVEIT